MRASNAVDSVYAALKKKSSAKLKTKTEKQNKIALQLKLLKPVTK